MDARITRIAADRQSGASELLDEVVAVLRDALARGDDMAEVSRALCRAQPSMAPVWNAALEAMAAREAPERFERFLQRLARAPRAMARFAAGLFAADEPGTPLALVTISFSRSVRQVMAEVARVRPLSVACAEGRPALEGRRLAAELAASGIEVTCFGDAAIGHALATADAVLVGADAITPDWFLNKSGTRMLAAAAAQQGRPVYVAATRDKFVGRAVAARLVSRDGAPAEIWDAPPAGVTVRNPYFERTPLDLVAAVISDAGVLGAGMVPDVCLAQDAPADALKQLDA